MALTIREAENSFTLAYCKAVNTARWLLLPHQPSLLPSSTSFHFQPSQPSSITRDILTSRLPHQHWSAYTPSHQEQLPSTSHQQTWPSSHLPLRLRSTASSSSAPTESLALSRRPSRRMSRRSSRSMNTSSVKSRYDPTIVTVTPSITSTTSTRHSHSLPLHSLTSQQARKVAIDIEARTFQARGYLDAFDHVIQTFDMTDDLAMVLDALLTRCNRNTESAIGRQKAGLLGKKAFAKKVLEGGYVTEEIKQEMMAWKGQDKDAEEESGSESDE
ncbi:hypothetical protein AUEXF2481DRAFT_41011 [Aureobasidium subglaciale EXF-2481]|uniref:Uncharacterized protein n=1 Tax=Aureobasidium subglaciale (strain EXF-2481) TaxID=1043005 RepID=A0A074YEC7_AURSE|nr:uncharacterized protein AUEXF2481DRAFT_41011 [Aureobasidium subglaciale EXF-2481]KEQ94424.1 hypothetical protein AUEXF2481DRAFT_41011 [Aureobasidium subglaciale EXF-2481]